MKNSTTFLLLIACMFAFNLNAQLVSTGSTDWYYMDGVTEATLQKEFNIPKASTAPLLDDNVATDAVWDEAAWQPYQVIHFRNDKYDGSAMPDASELSIQWKALWTEESVYFLFHVVDDTIVHLDECTKFWAQDAFEAYFLPAPRSELSGANRNDSTTMAFHVIMPDTDGSPVKVRGQSTDAANDIWTWAGCTWTQANRQMDAQVIIDGNNIYYEVKTKNKLEMMCGDSTAFAENDIVSFEFTYNETDTFPGNGLFCDNRDIIAQIAVTSDEASKAVMSVEFAQGTLVAGVSSINSIVATKFSVAPNPANTEIKLNAVSDINIYNISGQIEIVAAQTDKVDISSLKAGIYFVRNADGEVVKLMVK